MSNHIKDQLFAQTLDQVTDFRFDQQVVDVFPDMIERSVPGYRAILSMISDIAGNYVQNHSHCYDLGCSLGAATLAIRHGIQAKGCKIISIDNSQAMMQRCQEIITQDTGTTPVELRHDDIGHTIIENASLVVLNFTLQFIDPQQRTGIINNIYQGLRPNGVLILSEKLQFKDTSHQRLMVELHHQFKRLNGYSELEIAQKRSALENILRPEMACEHKQRLQSAGFSSADLWFQCFNFASFIAIK